MSDAPKQRDSVAKFLFHLGKGLWKSLPIVGPVVDEVVYAQYEGRLKGEISRLSERDIGRIVQALPAVDAERIVERVERVGFDLQIASLSQLSRALEDIHEEHSKLEAGISDLREQLDDLPSVLEIVTEIRKRLDDRSELERVLDDYERRRRKWIERLSTNQKNLLAAIPDQFTAIEQLWTCALRLIPSGGYKEFRFRLHELEWLGLVERRLQPACSWEYRRLEKDRRGGQ